MVICFESTPEAKKALDTLLETRQFRDHSEAISMALVNYEIIQQAVSRTGELPPEMQGHIDSAGISRATPGGLRRRVRILHHAALSLVVTVVFLWSVRHGCAHSVAPAVRSQINTPLLVD